MLGAGLPARGVVQEAEKSREMWLRSGEASSSQKPHQKQSSSAEQQDSRGQIPGGGERKTANSYTWRRLPNCQVTQGKKLASERENSFWQVPSLRAKPGLWDGRGGTASTVGPQSQALAATP